MSFKFPTYKKSTKFTDVKGRVRYSCVVCNKDYASRPGLSRHQRDVHPEIGHLRSVGRKVDPSKRPNPHLPPKERRGPGRPKSPDTPPGRRGGDNVRDELMQMFKDGLISAAEFKDLLTAQADSDSHSEFESEPELVQWNPTLSLQGLSSRGVDSSVRTGNREAVIQHIIDSGNENAALQACIRGDVVKIFDLAYKRQLWLNSDVQVHYLQGDEIQSEPLYPDGELDLDRGIIPTLTDYATSGLLRKISELIKSRGSKRTEEQIDELFVGSDRPALMDAQMGLLTMMTENREDIHERIASHIKTYQRDDVDFCLPAE